MIELHQIRPFWGLPNASPFCMKVETYLRYRSIPFRSVPSGPRRSPSGQIPFVVDGERTVTDSQAIIEHFEARQPTHLDADLDAAQRATAFFVRELVEERLYWQITYMRWGDPAGWRVFKPDLMPYLPKAMRGLGLFTIRCSLLRRMRRRGLSPDDPAAAYAQGMPMLDALSHLLADKPFFLGETPHSLDMSLHAFLANILEQPHGNPLQAHGRSLTNLVDYTQRMKALCYDKAMP
ncbi:MAG TPA: glutathione S-transferase family protein [Halomonas sp.]|nr:glutathione S-transferase family protein [Halomonas sp.]